MSVWEIMMNTDEHLCSRFSSDLFNAAAVLVYRYNPEDCFCLFFFFFFLV